MPERQPRSYGNCSPTGQSTRPRFPLRRGGGAGRAPAGVVVPAPWFRRRPTGPRWKPNGWPARSSACRPRPTRRGRPWHGSPVARLAPAIVQRQAAAPRPGGGGRQWCPRARSPRRRGETPARRRAWVHAAALRADFRRVRIHTDERAARLARQINAKAFTVGERIFSARTSSGPIPASAGELIAHELTHTIQQGRRPSRRRCAQPGYPGQCSAPEIQRGWLPDPWSTSPARPIRFRLHLVYRGHRLQPDHPGGVDRSAGNILQGAIELIPGGSFITEALNNHGIFARISTWTQTQFDAVKDVGSTIWSDYQGLRQGV